MRYILSCIAGIGVSLTLFLMMTYLIDKHDARPESPPRVIPEFVVYEEPKQATTNDQIVEPPRVVNQQPTFITQKFPIPTLDPIDMPTPPKHVQIGTGDIPVTKPGPPVLGKIAPPDLTVLVGSMVKYPKVAERRNLEGFVVVENEVDKYGKVVDVRVIESSHSVFEKAARDAVFKWKYSNSELTKRVDRKRIAFKLD